MDVDVFTSLLSSVGFPITCCIALFWYVNTLQSTHREEMCKLADSIDKNTEILHELSMLIKTMKG